jgi:hypothetical protein
MKFTLKKIIIFFSIIGLGIIGLMVADQYNFLNGRKEVVTTIGNGTPDPLVSGSVSPRSYIQPGTTKPTQNSSKSQSSGVDGIKKAN